MNTQFVVLTGPESSGKTTLACQLADHWKSPLVVEMAREYLAEMPSYQQSDLLEIARQQDRQERALLDLQPERVVCDTDLLVIMIWSEVKYGKCDPWIYATFEEGLNKLASNRVYLLCDSGIPWQEDPLRENPSNRDELFDLYLQKVKAYGLEYEVIAGNPEERFRQALNCPLLK